jgi:hypothetical protein
MSISYLGFKKGKHLLKESLLGVRLNFTGPDASKFVQVKVPKNPTQTLEFSLTLEDIRGILPPPDEAVYNQALNVNLKELSGLFVGARNDEDVRISKSVQVAIRQTLRDLSHEDSKVQASHCKHALWMTFVLTACEALQEEQWTAEADVEAGVEAGHLNVDESYRTLGTVGTQPDAVPAPGSETRRQRAAQLAREAIGEAMVIFKGKTTATLAALAPELTSEEWDAHFDAEWGLSEELEQFRGVSCHPVYLLNESGYIGVRHGPFGFKMVAGTAETLERFLWHVYADLYFQLDIDENAIRSDFGIKFVRFEDKCSVEINYEEGDATTLLSAVVAARERCARHDEERDSAEHCDVCNVCNDCHEKEQADQDAAMRTEQTEKDGA